jgi:ligand-binding sensor domain-containing protein
VFTAEDGLESASITAMTRSPDGRIYAAHHVGISVIDPTADIDSGHWVTLPNGDLSENDGWVNALAFTPDGHLWAGTHAEWADRLPLWYYDGKWTDHSSSLYFVRVGALLVDREGDLWMEVSRVKSCGGVRYWPAASANGEPDWQDLDPQTLAVCNVFAMAQDTRGRVWIGGSGDVVMWEGE